ncbi:MAG: dephospho-CoA kinase [Candidatus Omnitrophica bacterium]|nr:dephospho-CoA kinase [Candidatus Omnitrophota bacterium]
MIIGVTGNIACGKSTVAGMLKTKDCQLINADYLGHKILSAGTGIYKKILKLFGRGIINPDNSINRVKLSEKVFSNRLVLAKFNSIIHPELIRQIRQRICASDKMIIILDAALIVEAGLTKLVDKLVVVTAKKHQQIARGRISLGLTKAQMLLRMKSQISQKAKSRFADFIIDNSGQISETQKQVVKIRRALIRCAHQDFSEEAKRRTLARYTRKDFVDRS